MEAAGFQPQNAQEVRQTKLSKLMTTSEMQPLCSCGSGEKVVYVCTKTDCSNRTKQPLYCIECCHAEPPIHDHRSVAISYQIQNMQKQWLDLRKEVTYQASKVNDWLSKYSKLLDLLTESTGITMLKQDIARLIETERSIESFYQNNVQLHASAEDLVKLSNTKNQFEQFVN